MAIGIDDKEKQPSKTTGFTNTQDLVSANRQNRLGQAVSGGVSNVVNKGQQNLNQSKDLFNQQSQQNAVGTQADKDYVNQSIAAPDASQANIDRFAQLRSGNYAGPMQLNNQDQLQAQGQDLQGIASAATGAQGQRGLLQRFAAPGQYTQGQQRLDSLLLGQTGGQALNQARRSANLFNQNLGQSAQSAAAQAQGNQQQAQQFGQDVNNQLGTAQTGIKTGIDQRQTDLQNQSQATRDALYALLSKAPPAPNTSNGGVSTMPVGGVDGHPGITQEQYDLASKSLGDLGNQDWYGAEKFVQNPEDLLNQQINAPTEAQVATEDEKARSLALAKLAGQNPTLFQADTKVGGYDPTSFLNKDYLNNITGQGKAKYDEGQTDIKNAGYIKQATDIGAQVRNQLQSDAAIQAKYQQDTQNYQNQLRNGGGFGQQPQAPGNPIDQQGRLNSQQALYNQANELLKQGGIYNTLNFQQPGDRGQWQSYNAAGMIPAFDNPYNRMLTEQSRIQNEGNQLTKDYAKSSLLDRLKGLIAPSGNS